MVIPDLEDEGEEDIVSKGESLTDRGHPKTEKSHRMISQTNVPMWRSFSYCLHVVPN